MRCSDSSLSVPTTSLRSAFGTSGAGIVRFRATVPYRRPNPVCRERADHARLSQRRMRGLPGSLGSLMHVPCSPTPAGRHPQAIARGPCCLPSYSKASAPASIPFRGSVTRPVHSLCTLRTPGHPGLRNTRYQLLAKLCWAGILPPLAPRRGFLRHVMSSPPRQSFPGAPNKGLSGLDLHKPQ